MSQENVKVVREILTEFATTHQAVARLNTPDSVWDMRTFRGWPDVPAYVGPDGFDEFFAKWTDPYEDWETGPRRPPRCGRRPGAGDCDERGRLRETDDWVELRFGLIFTVIEGLVSHTEAFATGAEALEAAGLRE